MRLVAENISRQFIRKTRTGNVFNAVEPMDLTLEGGRLTVLLGRSGGGKSTLLNMLAGLLEPTTGEVKVFGAGAVGEQKNEESRQRTSSSVSEKADTAGQGGGDSAGVSLYKLDDGALSRFRNRYIGVVPQGQTAVTSLSVEENIALPYTLYGVKAPQEKIDALMKELDISRLKEAYPAELSGGEMRRMAIARALMRDPGVILADEPTGDLDDENTETVLQLLKHRAEAGACVLLVTHEERARVYADDIWKMAEGRIEF